MRKILWILLVAVAALVLTGTYHVIQQQWVDTEAGAVARGALPFWVPVTPMTTAPDSPRTVVPLLEQAADEAHINLWRTSMGYTPRGQTEVTQYGYLTTETSVFHAFTLVSGSWLSPSAMRRGGYFLSSAATGNPGQVGRLRGFAPMVVAIRPLKEAFGSLAVSGEYWVESASGARYDRFVGLVAAALNRHRPASQAILRDADFETGSAAAIPVAASHLAWGSGFFQYLVVIRALMVAVATMLILYGTFAQAGRIGTVKLQGWSNLRVWFWLVGQDVCAASALTVLVGGIAGIAVHAPSGLWVATLLRTTAVNLGLVAAASLVALLYSRWLPLHQSIQGRRDSGPVLAVHTVVKAAAAVVVMIMLAGIWTQAAQLQQSLGMLRQWDHERVAQHYGTFYPVSVGPDLLNMGASTSLGATESEFLYPYLARRGSIYIDAYEYEASYLLFPEAPGYVPSITVNRAYLRTFPVFTARHRRVTVAEATQAWVLLVPERDRARAGKIRRYFLQQRREAAEEYALLYHAAVSRRFLEPVIRIVWTANDQSLFSWDPDVFPRQRNSVVGTVVQVMTASNSLPIDRINMVAGQGVAEPLKIPLVNGSASATFHRLQPELRRLHLTPYLSHFVSMQQALTAQISTARAKLREVAGIALGIAIAMGLLVIESVEVLVSRFRQRFVVRRMFGLSRMRTYREYWIFSAGVGAAQGLIGWAVIHSWEGVVLAVGVWGLEAVVSIVALRLNEQKRLVQLIKEGG